MNGNIPTGAMRNDPIKQGDYLFNGQGPFALADALAAQQQAGATPQQEDLEKQLLDQLKAQEDKISNSNKIKEMALKLMEEMQKSQELEARMQEHPEVVDMVMQLLQQQENEGQERQ